MENKRKQILVTGGTSGIGAATVHLLAKKGYEVHMTYRNSAKTADEFTAQYPGQVFAHQLDQGVPKAVENADFLTEIPWDGIIFNAALGSATVKKYARDNDPLGFAMDETMLKVNALGTLWIYKKVKDMILKRGKTCKMILMSSVGGGVAAFPYFSLSDGMSKSAVSFLGRQLSTENVHTPIDVFVVCPGATETPMFTASTLAPMTPQRREEFVAHQAKGRLIQPEDIAWVLYQLLQEESTVLHGCSLDASMGLGVRPGIMTEDLSH